MTTTADHTTVGERFAHAIKGLQDKSTAEVTLPGVDVKTLMTTSAGYAPESHSEAGFAVDFAARTPTLLDVVLATPTASDPYQYMEETTFTNAAAERAEGGAYGEAALEFTKRSSDVGSIGVWLPVTDEQLEDPEGLAEHVDQRLGFMLRQRLELQMLVGNGTTPNLRGIVNVAGVQTQPKSTDTAAVAIRKAITKVRTPGYGIPDLTVLNPTDSEAIDLAAAGADPMAAFTVTNAVWTVPRQEADAMLAGTAVVGDFTHYSGLRVRKSITLQVTNSHGTFFTEGKKAVRATIRVAFPIFRPAAFCLVTGL